MALTRRFAGTLHLVVAVLVGGPAAAQTTVSGGSLATQTWTLAGTRPAGDYRIIADVRTDPNKATRDAFAYMTYSLVAPAPSPATGVTLTTNVTSPQIVGTDVVFTAQGQGSSGYLYRFWLTSDGGVTFSIVQDWSATATWTLPSTTAAGTYQVIADVKTDPYSNLRDAYTWMDYVIAP